jgi:acyl-CoA dehydrogenase
VSRAQAFVRAAARRNPGTPQPGALRVAEASNMLQMLKSEIIACLKIYNDAKRDPDKLASMGFAIAMNNLKVATSQTILQIINHAMLVCGIMGYKNGTPYSLGRHLRDAHSAQLMISNERILGNTATMLLIHKQNTSLLG